MDRDSSRFLVLRRAVRLLPAGHLADCYASAWGEWADGDAALWESASADGLAPAGTE